MDDRIAEINAKIKELSRQINELEDERWSIEKKIKSWYIIDHNHGDEYQYTEYIMCGEKTLEEVKEMEKQYYDGSTCIIDCGDYDTYSKICDMQRYKQAYNLIHYTNPLYECASQIEDYIKKLEKELETEKGIRIRATSWGHSFHYPSEDYEYDED